MIHTHYVVVLVIRKHGGRHQLLLARREPGKYMGDTWQLISGGLEPNETASQAALREMREETGLAPLEFYLLSTLTNFYRSDKDSLYTAPMFCALVGEDAAVAINSEHTAFEWVAVEDAASRLMWPSDRQALAELLTVILGDGMAKPYMRIASAPTL
ncbi:MAG: NUDIX hydrolase [Planctomycetaceae bacterium]